MEKYYIVTDNEQKGPYSIEELQELNISLSTLVWNEGMENWVEAKNVPELRNIIKISPPPIPKISDVTYKVEAEIKQNKEKLIKPETEIAVAKEIKIASRLALYSLIAIVLAFPIILQINGGFNILQRYIKKDCKKEMQKLEDEIRSDCNDVIQNDVIHDFTSWFHDKRKNALKHSLVCYFNVQSIEKIIQTRLEEMPDAHIYQKKGVIVEEYMRNNSNVIVKEYVNEHCKNCDSISEQLKDDLKYHCFEALKKSLFAVPITAVLLIIGRYVFKGVKWVDKTSKMES
jgi:hypothetical protein